MSSTPERTFPHAAHRLQDALPRDALPQDEDAATDYVAPDPPEIRLPSRRRFSYDIGLVESAVADAYALRVTAERALSLGRGDEAHPVLVALRTAVAARANGWRHEGVAQASPQPPPHRDGVVHRDGIGPSRTHGSPSLDAALTIAGVLGGDDAHARQALSARVDSVRRELKWASASPLARDVIDQYALATAHAEVLRACAAVFDEDVARDSTASGAGPERPAVETLERLAEMCGQTVPAETVPAEEVPAKTGPSDDRGRGARNRRAWQRRLSRAERGLKNAARLVRHARKAGWIPPQAPASARVESGSSAGVCPAAGAFLAALDARTEVSAEDPLAPLAAPAPEPKSNPLRGEAAEVAAETRARIDAKRAKWPPPDRITWAELDAPDCPWNPFDYGVECDAAGHAIDGGRWAVLVQEPEDPDDLLADLATWAPEYAAP